MNEHKVQPWTEMPLWIPETFIRRETKPWKGGFSISINSAIKAGLTFRRLEDTVMDVYVDEEYRGMGIKSRDFRRKGERIVRKMVSINLEELFEYS